jgi:hypothetical protein
LKSINLGYLLVDNWTCPNYLNPYENMGKKIAG